MAYSSIVKPSVYFNTKLYTGNGSTQSITGVGFQPDMTWVKVRSETGSHRLADAVRGYTKYIFPNGTDAEGTSSTNITSWNSDGFALGNGSINENTRTYASWNWKAGGGQGSSNTAGSINTTYTSVNTTAGCSISSYTGNGSAGATVGHGLGAVPKMIIIKQYSSNGGTENWYVYHASLGNNKDLLLNLTNDASNTVTTWNTTTPSSTLFTLGSGDGVNNNTVSYIAYCFAEKKGYSKFGSYTGNGNSDGPFVYTGFKPAFVIYKGAVGANAVDNWEMADNKRSPYNGIENVLYPNLSSAEGTGVTTRIDMLSNGFKMRTNGSDYNGSGQTYIYMAFAEEPLVANSGTDGVPATAR